jgi:hypothetical protein
MFSSEGYQQKDLGTFGHRTLSIPELISIAVNMPHSVGLIRAAQND